MSLIIKIYSLVKMPSSSGRAASATIREEEEEEKKVDDESSSSLFAYQTLQLIPAEVRMISGCHTEQTSADVSVTAGNGLGLLPNPLGKSGGACTSALLDILYHYHHERRKGNQNEQQSGENINNNSSKSNKQNKNFTFQQVLLDLRQILYQKGFEQIPQLTSSRNLEINEIPFTLRNTGGNGNGGICRALLVGINYIGQNGQLVSF